MPMICTKTGLYETHIITVELQIQLLPRAIKLNKRVVKS